MQLSEFLCYPQYDPVKEEEQRLAALNVKLEALEQQIYQRLYAQSQSWLSSFASSYFTSMIENLKVGSAFQLSVQLTVGYLGMLVALLIFKTNDMIWKQISWRFFVIEIVEGLGGKNCAMSSVIHVVLLGLGEG